MAEKMFGPFKPIIQNKNKLENHSAKLTLYNKRFNL